MINTVYFGGAVLGGQASWRNARQKALLAEQTSTIHAQSDTLRRRAVTDERLRIARELHDVVGHHVSVIGIQAAAARRVIDRDPDAAASALGVIERSSREAVTQMRSLLGTLRELGDEPGQGDGRAPEPGIDDLPALAAERTASGLRHRVRRRRVQPRCGATASGSARAVAVPRRPGGARQHDQALDRPLGPGRAAGRGPHVDALRRGRGARRRAAARAPRPGRAWATWACASARPGMRGEVEIGPRPTGGYRVRVRVPLEADRA